MSYKYLQAIFLFFQNIKYFLRYGLNKVKKKQLFFVILKHLKKYLTL